MTIDVSNHPAALRIGCLLTNQYYVRIVGRVSGRCHKLKLRQRSRKKSAVLPINFRELSQVVRKLIGVRACVHVAGEFYIRDLMSSPSKLVPLFADCKPIHDHRASRDHEDQADA